MLAAIGNKSVNEGSLLTFTATATDADAGQTRTFSLDAGAPTGATINATTGVFSWTPTESQGRWELQRDGAGHRQRLAGTERLRDD